VLKHIKAGFFRPVFIAYVGRFAIVFFFNLSKSGQISGQKAKTVVKI